MKTVELETAKLAKEKGYDNFFSKTLCGELIQAYQYDIMDWLREEHNIYISIIPSVTMAPKSKVSFTYQISSDSDGEKFNIYSSSMDCYSNYEECLETALKPRVVCWRTFTHKRSNVEIKIKNAKGGLFI